MVMISDKGQKERTVCPRCRLHAQARSISPARTDRYGRTVRSYYIWCEGCLAGFEVEQFRVGDDWHIHRYRYYAVADDGAGKPMPQGWTAGAPLPEPAPVVVGPGGGFDRAVQPTAASMLQAARKLLEAIYELAGELIHFCKTTGEMGEDGESRTH